MRWPSKDPADYYPREPTGPGSEHWARRHGGKYAGAETRRTRTQVLCTTAAVLACDVIARAAGLDFGELLTHAVAALVGIPLGHAIARRVEPPRAQPGAAAA